MDAKKLLYTETMLSTVQDAPSKEFLGLLVWGTRSQCYEAIVIES